jgi:hypothetical protein
LPSFTLQRVVAVDAQLAPLDGGFPHPFRDCLRFGLAMHRFKRLAVGMLFPDFHFPFVALGAALVADDLGWVAC